MKEFKEKTNGQILAEIVEMQQEHEAIKQKILRLLDKMEDIEDKFRRANEELVKRLKGEK